MFCEQEQVCKKFELHVYCDASDLAIGYVAYFKTFYTDKTTSTVFVAGNFKLAPRKAVTIPRLELNAALEASQAAKWISTNLRKPIAKTCLYSDSLVVLGYLRNISRRFSKYVSRRVYQVLQSSKVEQWHYIPSDKNPADMTTRPHTCQQLAETSWFGGPHILKESNVNIYASCCHTPCHSSHNFVERGQR